MQELFNVLMIKNRVKSGVEEYHIEDVKRSISREDVLKVLREGLRAFEKDKISKHIREMQMHGLRVHYPVEYTAPVMAVITDTDNKEEGVMSKRDIFRLQRAGAKVFRFSDDAIVEEFVEELR